MILNVNDEEGLTDSMERTRMAEITQQLRELGIIVSDANFEDDKTEPTLN